MVKPRSSNSASSCLCLRTARMSNSTSAARRPRMTTPTALTMAMIAVVLKEPLASARGRTFVIAIVVALYPESSVDGLNLGASRSIQGRNTLRMRRKSVLLLCCQLVSSSFKSDIQASKEGQQRPARRNLQQERSQRSPNTGPYTNKHTF